MGCGAAKSTAAEDPGGGGAAAPRMKPPPVEGSHKAQKENFKIVEAEPASQMTPFEWAVQTIEQPLYTDEISIVDPHHHLFPLGMPAFLLENTQWKNTMFGVGGRCPLAKPYMVQELVADMSYNNVTHTIHVECGQFYDRDDSVPKHLQCVGETKRLQEIADATVTLGSTFPHVNAGIVAHGDLDNEFFAEQLDAHIAAGKNVVGVRGQVAYAPNFLGKGEEEAPDTGVHSATTKPELLRDPEFRKGLAVLQSRNLVFDCFLYHPQLAQLAEVAAAFPDLTIVCEHSAIPLGISTYRNSEGGAHAGAPVSVVADWKAGITALSKHSNVYIKLGALTFAAAGFNFDQRSKPIGSEELANITGDYFNHIIDAFGADRCMFESNFPMDKSSCSYTVLWNSFKRIVKRRSDCDAHMLTALFGGTAKKIYKLS